MNNKDANEKKILLVEDEESLAIGLEYNLSSEGYRVTWAKDGREALLFFEKENFDLILLDLMLPYLNGFEVEKEIRSKSPQMPILILTAKASPQDKVKGLEIGADDYITKPFHLAELLLRIKGLLRRKEWYSSETLKHPSFCFGDNKVNFENLKCSNSGKQFILTHHEAMVLKYLVDNKNKIVSREELLKNVWQINPKIETRTVDIFISRLRKYFEPDPKKPTFIKSVRGSGYLFDDEN